MVKLLGSGWGHRAGWAKVGAQAENKNAYPDKMLKIALSTLLFITLFCTLNATKEVPQINSLKTLDSTRALQIKTAKPILDRSKHPSANKSLAQLRGETRTTRQIFHCLILMF